MIRSAVTISLVPEARGGPFIYWDDLDAAIAQAAELGFDALEVFAPDSRVLPAAELGGRLRRRGLALAAVGTGAGWVRSGWTLTSPDPAIRSQALQFVREMITWGAEAGSVAAGVPAPAIIGSLQGRAPSPAERGSTLELLSAVLDDLGRHAHAAGARLLIEPLNRYETNLLNTLAQGAEVIDALSSRGTVQLLADLFHMNIEEVDAASALRAAGDRVGHVHFVDSNRRPAGSGHLDFAPVARALQAMHYDGYASAEALPWPDSRGASERTLRMFRRCFGARP